MISFLEMVKCELRWFCLVLVLVWGNDEQERAGRGCIYWRARKLHSDKMEWWRREGEREDWLDLYCTYNFGKSFNHTSKIEATYLINIKSISVHNVKVHYWFQWKIYWITSKSYSFFIKKIFMYDLHDDLWGKIGW